MTKEQVVRPALRLSKKPRYRDGQIKANNKTSKSAVRKENKGFYVIFFVLFPPYLA